MQLRKIELFGFKSFADRTEITFDGGITAVVGPNGCGKSNVVDAIRWVLGEQSAKSLRAGSMGDCIFAGTETRKPLGFAEVTLAFDNSSHRLPIEYEEVAVTRRVYGSGEGEYFINRRPVRLKDIRELFMGTGVGTTAYSVIEQGEITRIVSSDPKELRAVFDEAAGIALYKSRLRAAMARLERVSQNLLRVSDVLAEVEKNLRSVRYQAAKAQRYQHMSERLKDLKLNRARRAYRDYSARQTELVERLEAKRREASRIEASLAAIEARSETTNAELAEADRQISDHSAAVAALESKAASLRHMIELCRERITHHKESEARLSAAIAGREKELQVFETRAVELERRTARSQRRTDRLSRAASTAAEREREAAEHERTLAAEITAAENDAIEVMRAGARLNNRLSEIGAGERAAGQHGKRLSTRLAELDAQVAASDEQRSILSANKAALSARGEELGLRRESLTQRKKAAQATLADVEQKAKSASERLAAVESRKELLEDLQRRRDGVSDAARALLELGLPGTRGLVAELLNVPQELAIAVENLLGQDAGAVVVDRTETALDAASRLRGLSAGRAKVISLERAATHADAPRRVDSSAAVFGPIAETVGTAPGCEALVNALLGNCVLAESVEAAVAANGTSKGLRIATRSGETVGPDGGISAGTAGQAGGLIWRKAEIERLAAAETDLRVEVDALGLQSGEMAAEVARLSEQASEVDRLLASVNTEIAEIDGRIAAAVARKAELAREAEVVMAEMASVDEELRKSAAEREAVRMKIEETRQSGTGLDEKISDLKARRTAAIDAREHMRAHSTSLKVALASSLEKQASVERQYADARSALEEKAKALETAVNEIAQAREAAVEEAGRLAAAQRSLEAALGEGNSARVVLAARVRRQQELREEAAGLAPALKDARIAVDGARQELSELSIEEREVSVRLGDVTARAREEFAAGIEELTSAGAEIADPAAADAEIEELSRKLASMGGVNMEALAELETLQSRQSFLAGQRDDLVNAKESLEGIIARTRATSRKMFMESFESVRQHFGTMFRRLFGGGRADCVLLDPEDVLESPVGITAKPPGKEPSSLNLLSGGEKAMTAVALLFAMFTTRPSPFLVLDEVDAPLDESNIGRFIDLMGDYLPTCQFVVITHNRRTMAAANALYGITMEEQGVSKKVSVSFRSQALTAEPARV